jgi:hypothetical protein
MFKRFQNAQIIAFPSKIAAQRISTRFDKGHEAQILFFMGVRYERHEPSSFFSDEMWSKDDVLYNKSA